MALPFRRRRTIYFVLLAGLLAIIWASYQSFSGAGARAEKPLSDLLTALDDKQAASGVFKTDGDRVDWTDTQGGRYQTLLPAGYSTGLDDWVRQRQSPVDVP